MVTKASLYSRQAREGDKWAPHTQAARKTLIGAHAAIHPRLCAQAHKLNDETPGAGTELGITG